MHASYEVTTATPVSAPALRYWEFSPPANGPAELYWAFGWEAVDSILKAHGNISDDEMNLIGECVNVALDVAMKAAGVPTFWLPQYEAATAHLKDA